MEKSRWLKRLTAVVLLVCLAHSIFGRNAARGVVSGAPNSIFSDVAPKGEWLDLLPNIIKGFDLLAPETQSGGESGDEPAGENQNAAILDVWNGEEVVPMELEDYIVHVVAAEMPASYALEALKAQAVAARTYAVKHMLKEERCKSGHTICTDYACCQAYRTTDELRTLWGDSFDKYFNKVTEAVETTKGEVIVCDGKLITAVYHSSSGGRTEDCEAVFAVALPYLVSVESEGEESSPEYSNETKYSFSEFVQKVNEAFPQAAMVTPVDSIDVWDRTESGRVKLVRLGDTVVTGQQMRNAFKLHSTNFSFKLSSNEVRITCLGFGHGVGMSQCGANAMAAEGADYREILTHYYTGVDIVKKEFEKDKDSIFSLWCV